jgi:hypothetical protein
MRTYHVRLFIPMIYEIHAEDEAQALEKVLELYRKLLAKNLHTWIEPAIQPEDTGLFLCRLVGTHPNQEQGSYP